MSYDQNLILAALAILVTSGLPVLYSQERVGKGMRPFRVHKFRTMVRDAEERTGPDFVFLTVSDDTDTARAAAFAAELGLAYPVGLGLGRMRGRHYSLGLPFTVLVDADGRGMYRWYDYGGDTQLVAIRAMVVRPFNDRHQVFVRARWIPKGRQGGVRTVPLVISGP